MLEDKVYEQSTYSKYRRKYSNISQDALHQAFLNALMEHETCQQAQDYHF
jgi:hypothetical protein